jgi:hypothetical protein
MPLSLSFRKNRKLPFFPWSASSRLYGFLNDVTTILKPGYLISRLLEIIVCDSHLKHTCKQTNEPSKGSYTTIGHFLNNFKYRKINV